MNTQPYQLTLCPTCQGFGRLTEGTSSIVCTECSGAGAWVEREDGARFFYPLPLELTTTSSLVSTALFWKTCVGASAAVSTVGLALLLQASWPDLPRAFFIQHPASLLFGLGGIASMVGVSQLSRFSTSKLSLHELLSRAESTQGYSLTQFAHPRLKQLLNQAAVISRGNGESQISEASLLSALAQHPHIQMLMFRLELPATSLITSKSQAHPLGIQSLPASPEVHLRMQQAAQLCLSHSFPYVDLEDVLLSYLEFPSQNPLINQLIQESKVDSAKLMAVAEWYAHDQDRAHEWSAWSERGRKRPRNYMNRSWTALPTPYLDAYSTDLTIAASLGNISTATVRHNELELAIQTLGEAESGNVVFVGDPGAGSDDLLIALASKMISDDVPDHLHDKRLIKIDLNQLLSSGDSAQSNLERGIHEAEDAGNVILALPDMAVLSSSGGGDSSLMTAVGTALKNRRVQIVATSTYPDYHRFIEQSSLLSSMLSVVELHELTQDEVVLLLEDAVPGLEAKYSVPVSYPAIVSAAEVGKRYYTDSAPPSGALQALEHAMTYARKTHANLVTKELLAQAVEQVKHVPLAQAGEEESTKLLKLEDTLHSRVVGQDKAVHAVAGALKRARAGLTNDKRPLGSFLFVGPTGVGKTELAKALCQAYYGPESAMVRFDMSEYQDAGSISKLIGSADDPVAEGGMLTQAVREHPFSLLLFDEIEKANPEVLNLFLQILDDARITENTGRTVNLNNCIIIATSNAASQEISQLLTTEDSDNPATQQQVNLLLEKFFKPEFINRFDGVIPFHPLAMNELVQIAQLILKDVQATALKRNITLTVNPDALEALIQKGFDPRYGARPLRRTIEQTLQEILANQILSKAVSDGGTLQITREMIH